MPKRLLDDSFLTSPSVAACSPRAQDAFPRLILIADDFGCFDANPRVIVGRAWPMRQDVTEVDVAAWLTEYEAAGMLQRWQEGGRAWGYLTGWFGPHGQRDRGEYDAAKNPKGSKRKTPKPPPIAHSPRVPGDVAAMSRTQSQSQSQSQSQPRGDALAPPSDPPRGAASSTSRLNGSGKKHNGAYPWAVTTGDLVALRGQLTPAQRDVFDAERAAADAARELLRPRSVSTRKWSGHRTNRVRMKADFTALAARWRPVTGTNTIPPPVMATQPEATA